MNRLYVSKSIDLAYTFVLWLENKDISRIVYALKSILKIDNPQVITNSVSMFAESLPLRQFVKFSAALEYDHYSHLTSPANFVGFIPHSFDGSGFLCITDIEVWNTQGEVKALEELKAYFGLSDLIMAEGDPIIKCKNNKTPTKPPSKIPTKTTSSSNKSVTCSPVGIARSSSLINVYLASV